MAGKIQGADVKTEAELVAAGATKSSLINDTQIYVTATGINKTLDDAITDGDIGGGGGGSNLSYRVVTTTDTATTSDDVLILQGSSFTQNLFTAVGNTGKVLEFIHNGSNFTSAYTIDPNGSQTIRDSQNRSTFVLRTLGERLRIVSTGSNWHVLQHETNTNWDNYDATLTGFGTVTNKVFLWRRIGDSIHIRGSFTTGTVASSIASISLPENIDVSKIPRASTTTENGSIVGHYSFDLSTGSGYIVTAINTDLAKVYFGNSNDTASAQIPQNGNTVSGNTDLGSLYFEVPISVWVA
jgi:hypothetical protein